ncbi:hypothetical protein M3P05_06730 [Sansalvadorimonas sp. 2012CJ34-2]|uniref:Membrane protein affecting hemolysin expression n=1 Tax=Parendozoicomonas callyspongiae TaxID=2942213 RepID=A0ABT0PE97_9GAMM|nr:hypothetical protein [Sansalvadorimonas sp. 2012CJ34-2]MCL6269635.1 hypothetical protein [Sansalvadorimonas sp. 2012CJ34-2]
MTIKRIFQSRFPSFSRLSIGRQIPLLLGGTLILSLLFAGVVTTNEISVASKNQADRLGNTLAEQTAIAARDFLVTGDRLSLNIMLSQLTRSNSVSRATIYSIDNKRIAGTEADNYEPGKQYSIYTAPINYQNVVTGELKLELDNSRFDQAAYKALLLFCGLAILLGVTGTVVSWNFARERQLLLTRSVRQLQGLSQGKVAYGKDVKDEVRQIALQLEYLITHSNADSMVSIPEPALDEEVQPAKEDEKDDDIILALRFHNLSELSQQLSREALLDLLEEELPLINESARINHGALNYSAEGNAYISFERNGKEGSGVFAAVCCAKLIQKLMNDELSEHPAGLTVELGISTLSPNKPGDTHPALSESATGLALMLARMGEGRLLMDSHSQECNEQTQTALIPTEFGDDIMEVGELPEEHLKMLARQAEKIRKSTTTYVNRT